MRKRTLQRRLREAWARLRGRAAPGDDLRSGREDFPNEEALVPVGPPKKPLPSSAVALPLPEPETRDVDAIGRDSGEDEPGDAMASR